MNFDGFLDVCDLDEWIESGLESQTVGCTQCEDETQCSHEKYSLHVVFDAVHDEPLAS
jgi:hypothetical protein